MKKPLLGHLICPFCHESFAVHVFQAMHDEIMEGYLTCSCRWYPIIKGVPRILPDELLWPIMREYYPDYVKRFTTELPRIPSEAVKKNTAKKKTLKGFGYEWKKFPQMYKEYTKQLLSWLYPVAPSFFRKKLVLDAGCGTGRHLHHAAMWGAEAIGIDLSEAVDVAFIQTRHLPKAYVVQADIYHLPFRKNTFDYIYSIGVLHHLPNPKKGFQSLVRYLKKKGHISIWVYGREKNYLLKVVDPVRKYVLSQLPLPLTYWLAFLVALLLYPVLVLIYYPLNSFSLTQPVAKILPQNSFFYYLSQLSFTVVHSIVFDQMLAPVAFYCSKEEVKDWYKSNKLELLHISWRNRNSWRAFGVK